MAPQVGVVAQRTGDLDGRDRVAVLPGEVQRAAQVGRLRVDGVELKLQGLRPAVAAVDARHDLLNEPDLPAKVGPAHRVLFGRAGQLLGRSESESASEH